MAMQIQSNTAIQNKAVRPDIMYRAEENAAIEQQREDNSLVQGNSQLIDEPPPPPPPYQIDFNRPPKPPEEDQPEQIEARPIANVGENIQNISNVLEDETTISAANSTSEA